MARLSAAILALQILVFGLGTALLVWALRKVFQAGGGFVPGYASIEAWRLLATLAPYLALPFGITLSYLRRRGGRYYSSVFFPLLLIATAFLTGRLFCAIVPDPIADSFGVRTRPYAGFLFLPAESIPRGFRELRHRYSKHDYDVVLAKGQGDKAVTVEVIESPTAEYAYDQVELLRTFSYQGIQGHVRAYDDRWGRHHVVLTWLNPPMQRVLIKAVQRYSDLTPKDLIAILASMKPVV